MNSVNFKSDFQFRLFRTEQNEVKYLSIRNGGTGYYDVWVDKPQDATRFDANNVEQLAHMHNAKLEVV